MEPEVIEVVAYPADPEARKLSAFFDTLEQESLTRLEEAARQVITLATTLLTLAVGLLALGGDAVPPHLAAPLVLAAGAATIVALFLALVAALDVVVPARYGYRQGSLADRRQALDAMLAHKSRALRAAVVFFGIAMAGLVVLVGVMLWGRV
mgnify:CR=1 FL=1